MTLDEGGWRRPAVSRCAPVAGIRRASGSTVSAADVGTSRAWPTTRPMCLARESRRRAPSSTPDVVGSRAATSISGRHLLIGARLHPGALPRTHRPPCSRTGLVAEIASPGRGTIRQCSHPMRRSGDAHAPRRLDPRAAIGAIATRPACGVEPTANAGERSRGSVAISAWGSTAAQDHVQRRELLARQLDAVGGAVADRRT